MRRAEGDTRAFVLLVQFLGGGGTRVTIGLTVSGGQP